MNNKVHIVMGKTGEYSACRRWPVKAFFDENKAADLVSKAGERARELYIERSAKLAQDRDDYDSGINEHDPEMRMDYSTGTSYFVMSVELDNGK